MQVDSEDFRRRFEDLSDEALLEVNREDLVDVARDVYDAELDRRGLKTPSASGAAEAGEAEQPNPQEETVLAGEFSSAQEVTFARSLLKSADIPTYVKTDFSGVLAATEENLEIFVPASFLQQARELLETSLTDEDLAAQAEAAGPEEAAEDAAAGSESNSDEDIEL